MKNLILFFFLMIGTASVNAQCAKTQSAGASCCAKKAVTSNADVKSVEAVASFASAEEAAAANENIMERVCSMSGAKSYYEKTTDANGKVSWEEVSYCTTSKTFKKVASASVERSVEEATNAAATTKPAEVKKSCCAGKEKSCAGKKENN